jgi:hypothetical protein
MTATEIIDKIKEGCELVFGLDREDFDPSKTFREQGMIDPESIEYMMFMDQSYDVSMDDANWIQLNDPMASNLYINRPISDYIDYCIKELGHEDAEDLQNLVDSELNKKKG